MTQFYSRIDTEFNGDVYSIPFSYSSKNEISVYIDDSVFRDWQFLNESQIQLTKIPAKVNTNSIVSIRRNTNISEKIVEYTNNTMLSRDALNLSQDQVLNAIQEMYDNNIIHSINLNSDFNEFTNQVNSKIEKVNNAADKLEILDETIDTTQSYAQLATNMASEATIQAQIATDKANESIETYKNKANTSLSNLTEEGEKHFLNKSQITNTILEAPNGIVEYSGNVVNVKSDIKVLFGDGRNSNQTLKSIEYTTGSGLTINVSGLSNALYYLLLKSDGSLGYINTQYYYEQQDEPEALNTNTQYWIDTKNNLCCFSDIDSTQWDLADIKFLKIALFNVASSALTSLAELSPVELLKRGDKSEITSLSAPSGKQIEYTLLKSGSVYTAPATGYWYLNRVSGVSSGSYATIYWSGLGAIGLAVNSGSSVIVSAYVEKGTQCAISHTAVGAIKFFGFIPAKGEVIDE